MFNFFKSKSSPSREDILNKGYKMSLAFGKYWLQPINERLSKKYPNLTSKELEDFNSICENLRNEANNFIHNRLEKLTNENQTTSEKALKLELTNWMAEHYSWVSEANIKRTVSQSLYYASKDGLTNCLK